VNEVGNIAYTAAFDIFVCKHSSYRSLAKSAGESVSMNDLLPLA